MILTFWVLQDSVTDYLHLLSFLNCCGDVEKIDKLETDSNDNLGELKKWLSQYTVGELNSKFIEFWVPSQISNVQLEQYCYTLLSNSLYLCLCAKTDTVGALRDMLLATRKVWLISLLALVPPHEYPIFLTFHFHLLSICLHQFCSCGY